MEENKQKKEFKLKKIKSRKELEELFNAIQQQGFGHVSDYKAHDSKIDNLKSKANTLNVDFSEYEINTEYNDKDSYVKIEKDLKKYFSKFKPDDKINELFQRFGMYPDSGAYYPHGRVSENEVKKWWAFRKKVGIKEDPEGYFRLGYYNFDKKFIKLYYNESYSYQFSELYELLYGEKVDDNLRNMYTGGWNKYGKLEIKIIANGTMNIKGDIDIIKKYLFKKVSSQTENYIRKDKKLILTKKDR